MTTSIGPSVARGIDIQTERAWPKITIVTPSLNQGAFLEGTIRSVIEQQYPNLEYIIIDGGSTDNSIDIIRKYAQFLTYWVSEPDAGQYHAIQQGFEMASGDIMAWINSDDKFTPWALELVAEIFRTMEDVEWLTSAHQLAWGERSYAVTCRYGGGYNATSFFKGANLPGGAWYSRCFVQQESTFWRRSLWERAGSRLDTSLELAADFELWSRFFQLSELYAIDSPIGGFRMQPAQKTAQLMSQYITEAEAVLRRNAHLPAGRVESLLRTIVWTAVGRRPLERLPRILGAALCCCGVLHATKMCNFDIRKRQWGIVTGYVV